MKTFGLFLSLVLVTVCGCTKNIPQKDIYFFQSEYKGTSGAKDMEFSTNENGGLDGKALSDNSTVPMTMSLGGGSVKYYTDAPGSENIKIKVLKDVGYTKYAGLIFRQEVTLNIWENGIIEVDQEGIECKDLLDSNYISIKGIVDGKKAIIMTKKR